jgi:neutral ceramidase
MEMTQLRAGAVQVDITPPVGGRMDGYGAREGGSLGVHDPLLAQLLLLQSGADQLVLISMDLLGVTLDLAQRVRQGIEQAIGVPGRCVMVTCTHTHSGPAGFLPGLPGIPSTPDVELQQMVERQLVGAALWARERLEPARLGVGRGRAEGIGRNRNDPEKGTVDDEVIVLRVDNAADQPLAVITNYGCHPTVLGYQNRLVSADYPGATRATLRRIYPDTVFMYMNGASGDVSTRFTRRSQSFAEVERMGRMLAGEVLKIMQLIDTKESATLRAAVAPVELKFRPFPSVEEGQRKVEQARDALQKLQAQGAASGEIRRAFTRLEGAMGQTEMARVFAGQSQRSSEVQVLEIGPLALVGLPGEPFTQLVLEIKQQSKRPWTAVVSYANDETGYFPDAKAIADDTYEALISPYGIAAGDALRETALRLLGEK